MIKYDTWSYFLNRHPITLIMIFASLIAGNILYILYIIHAYRTQNIELGILIYICSSIDLCLILLYLFQNSTKSFNTFFKRKHQPRMSHLKRVIWENIGVITNSVCSCKVRFEDSSYTEDAYFNNNPCIII